MRNGVLRLARVHFVYAGLLALQVIIYDAWKLIVPEVVLKRWLVAAAFMVIITIVWYHARSNRTTDAQARRLAYALIAADIAVATFNIYGQRGMASRAVMLYAIPLVVALVIKSRRALYATAALATVSYATAAVSYFILNFNEGYKIELYGEVGFYSAVIFIIAALLLGTLRSSDRDT